RVNLTFARNQQISSCTVVENKDVTASCKSVCQKLPSTLPWRIDCHYFYSKRRSNRRPPARVPPDNSYAPLKCSTALRQPVFWSDCKAELARTSHPKRSTRKWRINHPQSRSGPPYSLKPNQLLSQRHLQALVMPRF